ncbi:hypothetical protein GCM10029992_19630 [Glycomyces albus]
MPSEATAPQDERVRTVIVHIDKQYRAEHVKCVSDPFTVAVGQGGFAPRTMLRPVRSAVRRFGSER